MKLAVVICMRGGLIEEIFHPGHMDILVIDWDVREAEPAHTSYHAFLDARGHNAGAFIQNWSGDDNMMTMVGTDAECAVEHYCDELKRQSDLKRFLVVHRDIGAEQTLTNQVMARDVEDAVAITDKLRGRHAEFVACYTADDLRDMAKILEAQPRDSVLLMQESALEEEKDLGSQTETRRKRNPYGG